MKTLRSCMYCKFWNQLHDGVSSSCKSNKGMCEQALGPPDSQDKIMVVCDAMGKPATLFTAPEHTCGEFERK